LEGGVTGPKRTRQQAILEAIAERPIGSQEELRQILLRQGLDVTQSTLSRDLRDLRIARVPTSSGVRYLVSEPASEDAQRAGLAAILPQLFSSIEGVGVLAVLKTVTSGAQPVALALDREVGPDLLGTIAGDDTILLICRSEPARERVVRRLSQLAKRS
jgi:transcriptional regulator of arginine metabolism